MHKGDKSIAGEPHAHYLAPNFQLTIRPAHSDRAHDSYVPGLHHLCFQARSRNDVDACYQKLLDLNVEATPPATYPEYNPEYYPEYYATFFADPDGLRLEIVSRTSYRDTLADQWGTFTRFVNPLQRS